MSPRSTWSGATAAGERRRRDPIDARAELPTTQTRPPADARRIRLLAAVACAALAAFAALTALVATDQLRGFDAGAFRTADDLRAAWLDSAARAITTLGLIAVVGPAVALGGAWLISRRRGARGASLIAGAALAWLTVWIAKSLVDRSRPPAPLVHTAGQSYPSAHAANSVGWFALAIALAAVISVRGGRIAAIAAGALLAVLVGLSRVYLRAHYLSDVLGGEALAVAMYAFAAVAALGWRARRRAALHLDPVARRQQPHLD
ncbi:MAG TPA: phosphatase PAP2 family protein [Solirubrobacteraceae bacterium]